MEETCSLQVQSAHAGALQASDFDEVPVDFDGDESDSFKGECWAHDCKAQGRRAGGARAPYHSCCWHRGPPHLCTLQGHCTVARVEGSSCRRCSGEGCTCRCLARAHTHTHSLTLQTKAKCAGDLPCTHSLSIHLVWGGAGLQVLNVASRRMRTLKVIQIWRQFRKAQSTLWSLCCIAICTNLQPYCMYLLHIWHIFHI